MRIAFHATLAMAALAMASGGAGKARGAERSAHPWTHVERLRPGQTVRVLCADKRSWVGRLTAVSADALVLDIDGAQRKTSRTEILRVQVKSRANSALAGMAIGAAGGTGFGFLMGNRAGLKSGEVAAAAGLGAGLFAAGGAAIGSLLPGWKTVYEM